MTNKETADEIRRWVSSAPKSMWGWATDGCGYDQHIAFVRHRNAEWTLDRQKRQTFEDFCLEYAADLEQRPDQPLSTNAVDPHVSSTGKPTTRV